jgi:hypothetical protein
MRESSEAVIERRKVREVTGVLYSRQMLDEAIDALLRAGFDRADIDIIGSLDEVRNRIGAVYVAAEELPDIAAAPRREPIKGDDVTTTRVVTVATVASAGALTATFIALASGGGWTRAIIAAVAVGGVLGVASAVAMQRVLGRDKAAGLDTQMEARGLVLWVRVRSPEQEEKAQNILEAYGARAVRVHEIEVAKRPDDIPLATLRPDPWLGDERLGQP